MPSAVSTAKSNPGSRYSGSQLEALWINAGGDPNWARVMAAIALAESGGDPNALHNTAYPDRPKYSPPKPGDGKEYSVGLWQINQYAHPVYNGIDLTNPAHNAAAAKGVFTGKQKAGYSGPEAWSTYLNLAFTKTIGSVPMGVPGTNLLDQMKAQSQKQSDSQTGVEEFFSGDVSAPFDALKDTAKYVGFGAAAFGGGMLIIAGLVFIAADIGLSVYTNSKNGRVATVGRGVRDKFGTTPAYKTSRQVTDIHKGRKTSHTLDVDKKQKFKRGEPGSSKLAKGDSVPY